MKTIEAFYGEIAQSKELRDELNAAFEEAIKAFLEKHGCEADAKKFAALLQAPCEGEIGDTDAALATGGCYIPSVLQDTRQSAPTAPV